MSPLRCGKLLNFEPDRVEGRLIVTGLTPEVRRRFTVDAAPWQDISPECRRLRSVTEALLADWGAFLAVPLYQEALTHFTGGRLQVIQRVPLARGELSLGTQRMHLHAPGVAFVVTAYTAELPAHESSLRKLLALAPLAALEWLNLDHATIRFITLRK